MTLGRDTFGLTKTGYSEKLSRIIGNHRANSLLIGEPAEFVLRSCRLTERWGKMAGDPEVQVRLRYLDTAGGRRVKMLSLERGNTRQPVGKAKLIDELYPVKRIATSATPEEKHYNAVKAAMRRGILDQLKEYRDGIELPADCYLSGMKIRKGMRTDVDHVGMTFSEIADKFIAEQELCYTDLTLCGPPTGKRFKDTELWETWQEYHRGCARYALVLASANRSKGSDGYVTPPELYGSFAAEDPEDLSLDF
jgi:hypothetical protein